MSVLMEIAACCDPIFSERGRQKQAAMQIGSGKEKSGFEGAKFYAHGLQPIGVTCRAGDAGFRRVGSD